MDRSASEHDIKKAYKRLSRRYHPDKNHEPDAEGKFVEVAHGESLLYPVGRIPPPKTVLHSSSHASQHTRSSRTQRSVILLPLGEKRLCAYGEEQKRQIYDRHGEEGLKAHEGGQHQYANPFDMFSQFFGGGCMYTIIIGAVCSHLTHPSLHAVHAQEEVRRGPTSVSEFEVSLADIYKGASIDVRPFLFPPSPPPSYLHPNNPPRSLLKNLKFKI